MNKFVNTHFSKLIYIHTLIMSLIILYYARSNGLLPMPSRGMDQLTMLEVAVNLYRGILPAEDYMYTFSYNLYLYFLLVVTQGNLVMMRCLQAATCALIPVFIFKVSKRMRLGREFSQTAAIIYCFYGPAALISLSFLRAAPLALCFLVTIYFILKAYTSKKLYLYLFAGFFAGLTVLGRENFIPIILLPLFMLIFKEIRKNINIQKISVYFAGILALLIPFIVYNAVRFGKIAIIPGHLSNVLQFIHRKKIVITAGNPDFINLLLNAPNVLWRFLSSFELQNSLSFYAHRDIIDCLWVYVIPFNLILGFAALGLIFNRKNKIVILLSSLIACYVGTLLIFNMFYRYRIPVVPLLCILAAFGIKSVFHLKNYFKIVFSIVFIFSFFFVTYTSPNKLRSVRERKSVIKILIKNGSYAKAENYIIQLEKENHADTKKLWLMLIYALHKNGEGLRAQEIMINKQKQLKVSK